MNIARCEQKTPVFSRAFDPVYCGHRRREYLLLRDIVSEASKPQGYGGAAPPRGVRDEPVLVPQLVQHVVPVPPGRLRNPTVDDVARLVCFTAGLEASYRIAAERADYRLRPKCRRMADAIATALDEEGLR